MLYSKNTIYIIGNSKTQQNNPITQMYGMFFIGFVVDNDTSYIIDTGASGTVQTTSDFIKSIFVGLKMDTPIEEITREIESRYFGSSKKAIIVAFKDAQKKYFQIKNSEKVDD